MREKLEAAFNAAFPEPRRTSMLKPPNAWSAWSDQADRFTRLLDAEAWLDAAIMLVPEGWTWDVDATAPECGIDWTLRGPNDATAKGTADTPAEALLAAIEKARTVI